MSKTKWHKWPEALYVIHYSFRPLPKRGDDTVTSLTVDAHTFMEVEDFAKATCPEDWEVTAIEKAYYGHADMFGGEDGENIDVQLNKNNKHKILYRDTRNITSKFDREVFEKRNRFKVEVSSLLNAAAA